MEWWSWRRGVVLRGGRWDVVVVWWCVVWCGVVWCAVCCVLCAVCCVVWCGVVWCGVVWCGVVWCGVVWCVVVCGVMWLCCWDFDLYLWMLVCAAHRCQVGSLAGAAHALNDNAGVLRCTGCVQKSPVDYKGKNWLDFYTFSKNTDRECSCHVVLSSTRQHDDQLTINTTTS